MRKILSIISACLIGSTITVNAQQKEHDSKIASTDVELSNDAPMFIEGLSLTSPASKRVTTTVTPKEKKSIPVTVTEPAPTSKDKREIVDKIKDGLKRNTNLYAFIQDWYGTPYRMGGTTKRAIDCSAFTRQLFADVYEKTLERTAAMQYMMTKRIYNKSDLKEGDLVFFSIHTRRISHVGVYLGNGMFVHASSSRGVMISELDLDYWKRYYAGAGRLITDY